jgi:hypothetical protein
MSGTAAGAIKKHLPLTAHIKKYSRIAKNGCWLWLRGLSDDGYGKFRYKGNYHSAARWSYLAFVGKIPAGLIVLHNCDNPRCVNPSHLRIGTHKDNRKDFMERNPNAFRIMRANIKCANDTLTPEQRKQYAKMGGEAMWAKRPLPHQRKNMGVRNFWNSMSKKERAEFVKQRTIKIIAGHRRNRNISFGANS